jgi:hypothetical protein
MHSFYVEAKGLEPSNLLNAIQTLYQLSYTPESMPRTPRTRNTSPRGRALDRTRTCISSYVFPFRRRGRYEGKWYR